MNYIVFLLLSFIFLIDLFFYIPISIHFYFDKSCLYFYVFSIKILHIDKRKKINKLANKIKINDLKIKKNNLNLFKIIKLKKIEMSIKNDLAYKKPYIFYPIYSLMILDNITYSIANKNTIYINLELRLIDYIFELIKKRRQKNEGTSNK